MTNIARPATSRLRKGTIEGIDPPEKERIIGVVGVLTAAFLRNGNLVNVVTKIHEQGRLLLGYMTVTGNYEWPELPISCSESKKNMLIRSYSKVQRKALENKSGKVFADPVDYFFTHPNALTLVKKWISEDSEAKSAVATALRLKEVLEAETRTPQMDLRTYKDETVDNEHTRLSVSIQRATVSCDPVCVATQGGGDFRTEKQIVHPVDIMYDIAPPRGSTPLNTVDGEQRIINKEGKDIEPVPVDTVISIESQTRKGTLRNDELLAKTGASNAIGVLPYGGGQRNREKWAKTDCPERALYYRDLERFANATLLSTGIHYMVLTVKPFKLAPKVGLPVIPSPPRNPLQGDAKTSTGVKGGFVTIKRKLDGIAHLLTIEDGYFTLIPRSIEGSKDERPIYGVCDVRNLRLQALLEIVKGRAHVVRLYSMNGRKYNGSTGFAIAVQQAMDLRAIGLEVCPAQCACDSDGVIIESYGEERYYKPIPTCDVYNSTEIIRMVFNKGFEQPTEVAMKCVAYTEYYFVDGNPVISKNRKTPTLFDKVTHAKPVCCDQTNLPRFYDDMLKAVRFVRLNQVDNNMAIDVDIHRPVKIFAPEKDGICRVCQGTSVQKCEAHGEQCEDHICDVLECDADKTYHSTPTMAHRCTRCPETWASIACACPVFYCVDCTDRFFNEPHACTYSPVLKPGPLDK